MASPDEGPDTTRTSTSTKPVNVLNPLATQPTENAPTSSTPLEMSNLGRNAAEDSPNGTEAAPRENQPSWPLPQAPSSFQSTSVDPSHSTQNDTHIPPTETIAPAPAPPLKREQTAPAIGPSTDRPIPVSKEAESDNVLFITLLLTNGARHPYRIDEKYLKKRNVSVEGDNPINLSIYDLKNLIWRDWREEWEVRPTNPTSIRLIYAGHMPGDSSKLGDCKFSLGATPHVVHMTVKPQDFIDDEEAGKGGGRDREGSESTPRCRCCIVM